MKGEMTAKRAEHLKADPKRRLEIPAGPPPGLSMIIHSTGRKVWCFRYRMAGQTRKYTLGTYPAVKLSEARVKALKALSDIADGFDPALKPVEGSDSVPVVGAEWIRRELDGKRTAAETEWLFRKEIMEPWKTRRVTDIKQKDVIRLLDKIVDRPARVQANRVHSLLKRWFKWQLSRGILDKSPVAHVTEPTEETPRDRVLSPEELAIVWKAANTLGYPHGPWIQFMMLLGQRRTETASMRWVELDLQNAVWHMPATSAKMNKAVEVPLCPAAVARIKALPRIVGVDYLFSHRGTRPLGTFSEAKAEIDAWIESHGYVIAPWTFHDFRRNLSTFFAKSKVPPHISELVLSHSREAALGSMKSIYDQYSYLPEKRDALALWADFLENVDKEKPLAKASTA